MSIEWERAGDGSLILKIKLSPGVEPPRDLTLVSLEPLIVAGGIKDAVARARALSFSVHDLRAMASLLRTIKGVFVLKIAEDNYYLIKNILPQHETVALEKAVFMERAVGEERSTIKYVIAHNVRQGKRDSGASLERWLAHEP